MGHVDPQDLKKIKWNFIMQLKQYLLIRISSVMYSTSVIRMYY